MNNFILSISPDQYSEKLNFGEALGFGGQMILLGVGAVFAVLGIIWAILTIFKMVFTNVDKKEKPVKAKEENVVSAPALSYTTDAEIVAVIAAAIAMAEAESGNNLKFRVVSFKRK